MKEIIVLLTLCLMFIGCKEKYTQKEVDAWVESVMREYKVSEAERMKQAHREGYDEGKSMGSWEDKMRLLEELEKKIDIKHRDIIKILDGYRSGK